MEVGPAVAVQARDTSTLVAAVEGAVMVRVCMVGFLAGFPRIAGEAAHCKKA